MVCRRIENLCLLVRGFFMRIATWNVNSIRQRLDHLLTWLQDCTPDIVCLQEIKCVDEAYPPETDKYPYKLRWMSRLLEYSKQRLKTEEPLVLAGDFNVIPAAQDVHNPAAWVNDALFRPATRESFQSLLGLGLTDALRAVTDAPGQYTFWDYQAGAWQKNHGLRIDHLLLSPQASDRLIDVGIDSYVRAWEKPSDHVPVWIDLDLETAQ